MARVLIVDEEPMLRLLLRLVLENEGHDVRDADDGRDALILIGSWQPQVVVTELVLPGLDGADLIKRMRMRADTVDLRIVATAASIPPDADVDAAFVKPYEAQLVAKEIDSMLGPQPEDGPVLPRRTQDAALKARTAVLSDIWSRLVSVDGQSGHCDDECDMVLEEIRRLAIWVEERATTLQSGQDPRPDDCAYEVRRL